jgi:hypothetical protein
MYDITHVLHTRHTYEWKFLSAATQRNVCACHAGPVAPFPGHEPSPGSAEFVKGPTPPGGAAAAAEAGEDWQQEQQRLAAEAGTGMHIGE